MSGTSPTALDNYFDLPDRPGVEYSLLAGKLLEEAKPTFASGALHLQVSSLLIGLRDRWFPDLMISGRTDFVLGPATVQAPDVVVLRRSVFDAAPVFRGALRCAPDLAIEIVSPSESAADLDDKVANYLDAGTSTVWVIWPKRRHALAYHRGGLVQHVTSGQSLEAPEILHGAGIPLDEVFADQL